MRHRDRLGRLAVDRLADGPDRLGEAADIVPVRHIARLEMHLGDAAIVAHDEAVEDLGEIAALLLAEAADDAEVDGDDVASAIDEEVAGMHVGMEEAVAQRVAQERLDKHLREMRQVVARPPAGLRDRTS